MRVLRREASKVLVEWAVIWDRPPHAHPGGRVFGYASYMYSDTQSFQARYIKVGSPHQAKAEFGASLIAFSSTEAPIIGASLGQARDKPLSTVCPFGAPRENSRQTP